jgi:hypothetical protein
MESVGYSTSNSLSSARKGGWSRWGEVPRSSVGFQPDPPIHVMAQKEGKPPQSEVQDQRNGAHRIDGRERLIEPLPRQATCLPHCDN